MTEIKRALITGLQGFTGRYMAAELQAAGYQTCGIGAGPGIGDVDGYRQIDLLDLGAVKAVVQEWQPDVAVHLAGIAFVAHGEANAFYQVNLIGTRNLLEALVELDKKPKAVLLASSANVYGNTTKGALNEQTSVAPANDYAVSKLAMEYMARLYADKLPIVITRPFNYTGVGQTDNFLVPKIVSHFRRRRTIIELGNVEVWRDFGDVRSVVQAYRRLLENPLAIGQVVNVCSGQIHSLREVLDLCQTVTGHKLQVIVNPAFVRTNEVKALCGDATRLRSLVGAWQPISLRDTLQWMLACN